MTCLVSKDGNMAICGGFNRRKFHYFDKRYRYVLFADSLWYEPRVVSTDVRLKGWKTRTKSVPLIRGKYERIDLFQKRVARKLGFEPQDYKSWWIKVADPQLGAERRMERKWAKKGTRS